MSGDTTLPILCGTILCLLGFVKFPGTLAELLYPRFIIPIVVWLSTFGKVLLLKPSGIDGVDKAVSLYSVDALWFVNACLVAFWIGYCLPIGKWLARFIPDLSMRVDFRPHLLMLISIALLAYNLTIPFMADAFGKTGLWLMRARSFAALGGSALVGLAWGTSKKATFFGIAIGVLLVFGFSSHFMSTFSRGSGLPVLMAVFAFCLVRKRIHLVLVLLALAWTGYAGLQGLSGRGIYGHTAGLEAYWTNIRSHPIPNDIEASQLLILFHDCHAPLCVSMEARAVQSKLPGTVTPTAWLLNQIPVPRFVGLPVFNVNLGRYISGNKNTEWGYTNSMMGDLFLHFGWIGSLGFIVCGIVYRLVAAIGFRTWYTGQNSFDWYTVVALVSYFALVMGMYNNYRSWVTYIAYAVCITFVFYVVIRPFTAR